MRQEKGWVRRACKPPLLYRKIHQNYSQTSLKVSSFNLKILMNPPVEQGIHMRNLKLSNADRKKKRRGKYYPLLLCEPAYSDGSGPHWCPPPFKIGGNVMLCCRGCSWHWCPSPVCSKDLVQPKKVP